MHPKQLGPTKHCKTAKCRDYIIQGLKEFNFLVFNNPTPQPEVLTDGHSLLLIPCYFYVSFRAHLLHSH
ncbi:unnamed protein product [Ixodes pacificus]